MATTGDQQQLPDESYAEYMDRLYRATPYANRIRDKETGAYLPSSDGTERPRWSFRVPRELTKEALALYES